MIFDALRLSLLVAFAATTLVVPVGGGLAYLLARRKFPGRDALDTLLMLPMVLPPTVTGYYLIVLLGHRGLVGSLLEGAFGWTPVFHVTGAVIASAVVAFPLMLRTARSAYELIPRELELASKTMGKTPLQTFCRITLPLAKRGLIAGAILSFARAAGEFGATLMVAGNIRGKTQTLPLAIYEAFIMGNDKAANVMVLLLTLLSIGVIYSTLRISRI